MGRPRTKAPEVRRDELMNAAERLFLDKGIAATSVDQVVAAAGVAKGTFYLYFNSKESLLAALQDRFVLLFCELLQQAMDKHRPDQWRARLRAWVKAGMDGYLDHVALHDVIFHEFHPEDRRKMNDNAVIDQFIAFLSAGHEAGAWAVEDPRITAIMLFNALHGAADDAVAKGGDIDRRRIVRSVTQFFERAVGAR